MAGSSAIAAQQVRSPIYSSANKDEKGINLEEVPLPPPDLNEAACDWWHYYCALLVQGSCLRRTYMTAIHNLCIAHMLRDAYMENIALNGINVEDNFFDKSGNLITKSRFNPICDKLKSLLGEMDRLLSSMGFTAFTDRVHNYDSGGGNITKGVYKPPTVDFTPPPQRSKTA